MWTAGFMMAPTNTRIVRRSNALQDWAYGRGSGTRERMSLGSSVAGAGRLGDGCRRKRRRRRTGQPLLQQAAAAPGGARRPETGHRSERTRPRERALHGRDVHHHDIGRPLRATMSQQGDPGYKATSVLLGESGLALALDRDKLSDLRGVLTPAAAMGDALLARFPAAGVSLETARLD